MDPIVVENGTGGVAVVQLRGEHDLATAPKLEAAIAGSGDTTSLVVDLSETTFIDSTILGVLYSRLQNTPGERRFAIVLGEKPSAVRRTFEVTGLLDAFPVYPSRDDALAAIGAF